jgi:RNase P subunit RPR2
MKTIKLWKKMKQRFCKHICKTKFEPTDSDKYVIQTRVCMKCDKILFGPHEIHIAIIHIANDMATGACKR